MRDAELLVAHDRDVAAAGGMVGALLLAGHHAEGGVLEVLGEVGGRDAGCGVDQVGVHPQLVVVVLRAGRLVGLEGAQLESVGPSVGARGEDVVEAAAVVVLVGLGRDLGRERPARAPAP